MCSKLLCVAALEQNEYFVMTGKHSSVTTNDANNDEAVADDDLYVNGPQVTVSVNGTDDTPESVVCIHLYSLLA